MSNNTAEDIEWLKKRAGKITASNFATFIKKDKSGGYKLSDGKVAEDLIYKIAWERFVINGNIADGFERVGISSKATSHGIENEGAAVYRYQQVTGIKVDYVNRFVQIGEWIGGTPDGYVGEDGIIEVKCPFNGGNHLRSLLTKEVYNPDYIFQIQGYLWLTKRKWCDFISYDPDMPEGLDIAIIRVERDEQVIEALQIVISQVVERIRELGKFAV
jgi:hypothetical protein